MQETRQQPPQASGFTASANVGPPLNEGHLSTRQHAAPTANPRYCMQYKSRGVAVIINNMKFNPALKLDERRGTDFDAMNLHSCFGHLGFSNIRTHKNLKCDDIRKRLNEVALTNHNDHAMFVCAILSHGELGKVYGTDGLMELQEIVDIVKRGNSKGLAGKPKLLIIQACRGEQLDGGAIVTDAVDPRTIRQRSYRIPVEQDFLMAYSSTPGFFSWRNPSSGSFFILALTEEMKRRSGSSEVMTILTRVNQRVAYEFKSNTVEESTRDKKQMPCVTSMLTKELYFTNA